MTEKSLSDLMNEAFELSLDLTYENIAPGGTYLQPRDFDIYGEHADLISGWADGLYHKYYENISTGRCSINQTVNFDIGEFEDKVTNTIKLFQELLLKHGKPVQLTHDDMKKLGYRGSWAGYTKEEDRLYYLKMFQDGLAKAEQRLVEYKNRPEREQTWDGIYSLTEDIRGYKSQVEKYSQSIPV